MPASGVCGNLARMHVYSVSYRKNRIGNVAIPKKFLRYRLCPGCGDLLDTIQHLEACGVDLYLDQQAIDTTTPMGKLVFQLTGAFAEFERTMIRQRIKAGLKRAVAQGVKLGRPKIDGATERKVRRQLAKGVGILKVAKSLGIGTGTVQRISGERAMSPRGAEQ